MQKEPEIKWNHSHDFSVDNQLQENKVRIVFWLTTVVMILEIAAGTWSGSMALLADGWHMGTHSAAFAIAMFAYWYARKHSNNKEFSFGTGKVTYLGGFASAIALAIVALMMAIESVMRLIEPQTIHFNEAIAVAFIGLAVNIASVFVLHDGGHHHHHGHSHGHSHEHDDHSHGHDHNLKAAYFHVLADTLTSLLAIIALFTGKFFGWIWMDAVMGIVGAAVISRWSYGLIRETSAVLLDKTVDQSQILKLEQVMKQKFDVTITDIHIWSVSSNHQASIISVETEAPTSPDEYKQTIEKELPGLSHISVEVNRV